jgi:hypothetical protein
MYMYVCMYVCMYVAWNDGPDGVHYCDTSVELLCTVQTGFYLWENRNLCQHKGQ